MASPEKALCDKIAVTPNVNLRSIKQTGVKSNKPIKIKMEVDRKPPLGFKTEEKLLIRPFSFYVRCFF
jgi:hypothetical protein